MLPSIGQPIEGTPPIIIMTRRHRGKALILTKQCAYTKLMLIVLIATQCVYIQFAYRLVWLYRDTVVSSCS